MSKEKIINRPPQTFILMLPTADAKDLLTYHSLLHQWADEIKSESPVVQIGEHRWTLPWIAAAHDAVVARMDAIKPDWNHDSPLTAAVTNVPEGKMLEMGAVQIVSNADGTASARIGSNVLSKGALNYLGDALGLEIKPWGDQPVSASTLWHVMLIPHWQLERLRGERVKAAVETYKTALGPLWYFDKRRSLVARGLRLVQEQAEACEDPLESTALGARVAAAVAAGEEIGGLEGMARITGSVKYWEAMIEEANRSLVRLLEPITDESVLLAGRRMIVSYLRAMKGRPTSKAQALDVAREVALLVSKVLLR